MSDIATVQDFNFKNLATKVHHMVKVHNELAVFRHVKNPLGAVIATGRSIIDMLSIEPHKQQRFHAAG